MIRPLVAADSAAALALLRARPLQNVFLEHVVRQGALGRVPGFYGSETGGELGAVFMIGPQGGVALEVGDRAAQSALAEHAAGLAVRPRHIVGAEDVTAPFWQAYERFADPLIWSRCEPVYEIDAEGLRAGAGWEPEGEIAPALEAELDQIVANSGRQHLEDLGDDRLAADPVGFRRRHQSDVREGRWWVLREGGRIAFQVHVGPQNDAAIQIGGVITLPELRKRGLATRGVHAVARKLLERHPRVVLFCGEENRAARRVYERVGFRVAFDYRSYLLRPPMPCPDDYA